jgi:hypothetical protein
MSIGDFVKNFNNTLLSLAGQLSIICPNTIISSNVSTIETIIKNFPEKIIEQFVIHILPDKQRIDDEDENYFLNKSYDNITKNKESIVDDIFQFKSIWKQLTKNNKKMVINYMKCLCYFSQIYLINRK